MPRAAGTFTLVTPGNPVVVDTVINPTHHNNTLNDIADALTASIANDGQTDPVANLPMGGFKHTGAADATTSGQYLVYGQAGGSLGATTFTGAITMSAAPINGAIRVDVASVAGTTVLETALSNYIRITGTNTITAFTLSDGLWRDVVAGGAFAITTGASLIIDGLASGTTYTFASGDTFRVMGEASSVVRVSGVRLPGTIIGFAQAADGTAVSGTTVIPADDTIPQNTEGTEYTQIATAYTPRYANSLLRVRVELSLVDVSASMFVGAIFRDSTADAVAAQLLTSQTTGEEYSVAMETVVSASAASATTFKFHYGTGGAGTAYVNQLSSGAQVFSTVRKSRMTVEEIKQ